MFAVKTIAAFANHDGGTLLIGDQGIQAVLFTYETPDMIHPEEDSAYTHVYLLNVAGADMLDVEDKAYAAWRRHRPDDHYSMCLFMYSPEETRDRFPRYAIEMSENSRCNLSLPPM